MPKISALDPILNPADDDELAINDKSVPKTKKITLSKLKEYLQNLVGWITTAMIADKAATTSKMKPAYIYYEGDNGTASRQALSGTAQAQIAGMTVSYTTGPTTEVVLVEGQCLIQNSVGGGQSYITLNGVQAGRSWYVDQAGFYTTQKPSTVIELAANTTYNIGFAHRLAGGTGTACNATNDRSTGYSPCMRVLPFAR